MNLNRITQNMTEFTTISFEQFLTKYPALKKHYNFALLLNCDLLFQKLNFLKYDSFGFGVFMFLKPVDESNYDCVLRNHNDKSTDKTMPSFKDSDPQKSLAKFYTYCIFKGYLESPIQD